MTYTFEFNTPSDNYNTSSLKNILHIAQEDEKKHFIQYIQYQESETQESIELSYISIKVDHGYFL